MHKCQMYANCGSTKHIKCERAEPHENCNHTPGPCPKGIVFGHDCRVKCFEVKDGSKA